MNNKLKKEFTNSVVIFFVTLWFGFFGIHKFIRKDIKMGLIYLFTGGLIGIGWFIDVIKGIINMIKIYQKMNSPIINNGSILNNPDSKISNTVNDAKETLQEVKTVVEKFREKELEFSPLIDDYYIKYQYERNVAGVEYRDLDFSKLKNSSVRFVLDKDNQHDSEAVKIMQDDLVIGYVYKSDSTIREMIHNYIEKDNWIITGWLKTINEDIKKLTYQIAFYKQLDEDINECILDLKTNLTKTSKRPEDEYMSSRQENLECVDEEEFLSIEEQYDSDCLLVSGSYGNELGELSESVSNKVREYIDNNDYMVIVKITEMTESDSGRLGAKISIKVFEK